MPPASIVLSAAVYEGEWVDSDSNDLPDAGEDVVYTIVIANEGTVTLKDVEARSASGSVICTDDVAQPVAELRVGESYECTASREVCVFSGVVPQCGYYEVHVQWTKKAFNSLLVPFLVQRSC